MEKKTAMQELKDKLLLEIENLKESARVSEHIEGYVEALKNISNDIDAQLLLSEKEQIFLAFVAGDERGTGNIPFNCEQYYAQAYGDGTSQGDEYESIKEPFFCFDEQALGKESRCYSECELCKNKGETRKCHLLNPNPLPN